MVCAFRNLINTYAEQGLLNADAILAYCEELHINPDYPSDAAKEFMLDVCAYTHVGVGKMLGVSDLDWRVDLAVRSAEDNWKMHGNVCSGPMLRDASEWAYFYLKYHLNKGKGGE